MISEKEEASNSSSTETLIWETLRMGELMVRASTNGRMGKSSMENGLMASRMAMESGKESMEIHTLANGKTLKQMAMEFTYGKMEIVTRVNGQPVCAMATVLTSSKMEMPTSASISMGSLKAMDSISGRMATTTQGCS